MQKELDEQFPENKIRRERINKELQEKGVEKILKKHGFGGDFPIGRFEEMSNSAKYQGKIYDIPIVVHIIESDDKENAGVKLTDEEVIRWINDTNAIYATTYGNGFFPEENAPYGGTVMPFRLLLAKRDPNYLPTNGIIRYDARHIQGYSQYGIKNGANGKGANGGEILKLAPHWPETDYYNIYIITAFNGIRANHGLLGWATGPEDHFSNYKTMMKASVVKQKGNTTLAHEFGHSLGLAHPFHGVGYNSGDCPNNTDCTKDNDRVCDTEPTKSMIGESPRRDAINPCTQTLYQGGQHNIMAYSNVPRKFTPGQRDRALALFLPQKGILTRSLGAIPPDANAKTIDLTPTCTIPGINEANNNFDIGITGVSFGDIRNQSDAYRNGKFYTNYSQSKNFVNYTDVEEGKEIPLTLFKRKTNGFVVLAWIDYNDNGVFEDNERLFKEGMGRNQESFTYNVRIPETAVKNKYIRMRVKGDWWGANLDKPCGQLLRGDVEDYAIRILPKRRQPDNPYDGRVGINTEEPLATLDVRETKLDLLPKGTPQGVLFPRFTTQERDTFQNVKEGTMLYNTTLKCLEIYKENTWECFRVND
ncbi:MAG: GEVED domain-containing protein [Flavobacteriaceae bacterium]|nr:GEVED domain-containing protein [Flavobacteriaceae bacterium]